MNRYEQHQAANPPPVAQRESMEAVAKFLSVRNAAFMPRSTLTDSANSWEALLRQSKSQTIFSFTLNGYVDRKWIEWRVQDLRAALETQAISATQVVPL